MDGCESRPNPAHNRYKILAKKATLLIGRSRETLQEAGKIFLEDFAGCLLHTQQQSQALLSLRSGRVG